MRKLLGMLVCAAVCMVLGLGAPGCTKKPKEETTKVTTKTEASGTDKPGSKTLTTTTTTTKYTLKAPADVTITQGDTAKVMVNINRDKYTDPVDVTFTGLPEGVTVADEPKMIAKDASTADFTLKASTDAKVVDNQKVTVWSSNGGAAKQEETFKITVKKK